MARILIVDDAPAEAECIRFLMQQERLNTEVDLAQNGMDALAILRGRRYDLLITDIKMPLMDGLTLAREARALDAKLHIVLISGYGEFEYAKRAISLGVTDYLMKPVVPDEFHVTIGRVLSALEEREQDEMDWRLASDSQQATGEDGHAPANRCVETVKRHIYRHYGDNLSLSELARMCYLSPSHLCHVFKRETGISLLTFINNHRLGLAEEMLSGTPMRINAIAQAVGFKSTSYFCQRFRDHYGVTPEQYRQNGSSAARIRR